MSWLKAIRKGTKSLKNPKVFDDAVSNIKHTKSGIKSVDDVFKELPFDKNGDELVVNGQRWRKCQADLRVGNIRKALREMKIVNNITAADEVAFKKMFTSKVPEVDINKMKKNIDASRKFHSDLDIKGLTENEITKQLKQLRPKSKAKLEAGYKTILKRAGVTGVAVAGIYASIVLTNNMYEDLAKATKAREGCFLVSKVDKVTSSCKLILRSCGVENGTACKSMISKILPYNINIMLNHFLEHNDETSLTEIRDNLNITVNKDTIHTVLNQTEDVYKLQKYYKEKFSNEYSPTFANPCGLYNRTSGCIACNPSATTNSELYVDDSELADNYSLQCVTDSTVLETLVDIATNMGLEIFDATASNSIGMGNLVSIMFLVLTILLFSSLGLRFFETNSIKRTEDIMNSEMVPLIMGND